MFRAIDDPHLVPYDGSFRVANAPTAPLDGAGNGKDSRKRLKKLRSELDELQRMLYASDSYAVLLIFQAMDAAGKDGTMRDPEHAGSSPEDVRAATDLPRASGTPARRDSSPPHCHAS